MLSYSSRPVIFQLQLVDQEKSSNTHHSTHLEYYLIALLNIVYQHVLDEIRSWESEVEESIDLRSVSHSEDLGCHCWEYAQMPSINNVTQNYV